GRCRVPTPAAGRLRPCGCNCPLRPVAVMRFARRSCGRVRMSCGHGHNAKPVAVAETGHPIVSFVGRGRHLSVRNALNTRSASTGPKPLLQLDEWYLGIEFTEIGGIRCHGGSAVSLGTEHDGCIDHIRRAAVAEKSTDRHGCEVVQFGEPKCWITEEPSYVCLASARAHYLGDDASRHND